MTNAFLVGATVTVATLSLAAPAAASATAIPGHAWLQGQGVDVRHGQQCVELAQRLYRTKGWALPYAKTTGGYNGGAAFIPEGSPGLTRHYPGSGYVPVPGDLVIEHPTSSNRYGHVAVVDYTDGNTIHTVEQNKPGRHKYQLNGSRYTGGYGAVKVILHAPKNRYKNPSDKNHNPFGVLDEARSPAPGTLYVRGWAADPSSKTKPIRVDIFRHNTKVGSLVANQRREDVARVHRGYGAYHGFSGTFRNLPPGKYTIKAHGINTGPGVSAVTLKHMRTVSVANANPFGYLDVAKSPAPGTLQVAGWAMDPNAKHRPINVEIYRGGKKIGTLRADKRRNDVARAYPGYSSFHGFNGTFRNLPAGRYTIKALGVNTGPGVSKVTLRNKRTVTVANPNPFGYLDVAKSPAPGTLQVAGWAMDPNAKHRPINVEIYRGGKKIGTLRADKRRNDVARAYPGYSSFHGFNGTFRNLPAGRYTIKALGVNTGPGVSKVTLRKHKTVTVR